MHSVFDILVLNFSKHQVEIKAIERDDAQQTVQEHSFDKDLVFSKENVKQLPVKLLIEHRFSILSLQEKTTFFTKKKATIP